MNSSYEDADCSLASVPHIKGQMEGTCKPLWLTGSPWTGTGALHKASPRTNTHFSRNFKCAQGRRGPRMCRKDVKDGYIIVYFSNRLKL